MTNLHSTHWKQGLRSSDPRKRRKWRASLRQRHGLEKAGFSVSRRGGRNKGGRKQMRANASKRRQTRTNASKRRGANASKREQTWANVDKRKQTLTPPFIGFFTPPFAIPLGLSSLRQKSKLKNLKCSQSLPTPQSRKLEKESKVSHKIRFSIWLDDRGTGQCRVAPVRFGSVTVLARDGSSRSGCRFRRFLSGRGFAHVSILFWQKWTVPIPVSVSEKRFRRFRFCFRFLEKRFWRFRFPVPVRFLGYPDNGNDWRKFRAVPRSYPLRSLVLYFV